MSKDSTAQIEERILSKLEWPLVTQSLAALAQTTEGRAACESLTPRLSRRAIEDRWRLSLPLRRLAQLGYRAPIGDLEPMRPILKAAGMGQILDGVDLRQVGTLLESTRKVQGFASDMQAKCETLAKIKPLILSLPQLLAEINRTVGGEGELLDTASPELARIRRNKVSVRRRIEETIKRLLHADLELEKYLQDDFFTVRNERYVVPMRVDGRGRVKGSILDTSASGQTLFIEPAAVTPINDELQDLDIEEKLEIARIFRDLSAKVAAEKDVLGGNYDQLLRLDCLTAEADLASRINAGVVNLTDKPGLDLRGARHPLIAIQADKGKGAVANSVSLEGKQRSLIVSGPNAGGKTVVLKTVGLVHLMAKAGLLVPADETSTLFLFDNIFLEMGDSQNLTANLSTFSGHLLGLKPILAEADGNDLVLLDELAVGTDPQTGAAIATAILEDLADRESITLVTTHFDALKGLAIQDKRFRNGSMEFSLTNLKPTYQLILDVPGQSYGIEVAEQMGMPPKLIARAKELRGHAASALDQAVTDLMMARDAARQSEEDTKRAQLAAEAERERWNQEVELLKEQRRKAAKVLTDKYEDSLRDMRLEFEDAIRKFRQASKEAKGDNQAGLSERRVADETLRKMDGVLGELASSFNADEKLPGRTVERADLKVGAPVYVLPLKKAGRVVKISIGENEPIDVEVGIIKLRVGTHDLRLLSEGEVAGGKPTGKADKPARPHAPAKSPTPQAEIGFTPQTATNAIDLRGKDVDEAVRVSFDFMDRSLMRGEEAVILIHGHGTGALQAGVRHALKNNCPYDIRFRPGQDNEGGDGVTVVRFVR